MEYSVFERLLALRGVNVSQVAKATGIAASTFTDWKNGRSIPKADKLAKIADYFSVSLDELRTTASQLAEESAALANTIKKLKKML